MESRGWSQLWLDYEAKFAAEGKKAADSRNIAIDLGEFDKDNRVIKSAISELNRAFADVETPVRISFVRDQEIAKEGYKVEDIIGGSSDRQEETAFVISAPDVNGALYGAFHLIREKLMGRDYPAISVT